MGVRLISSPRTSFFSGRIGKVRGSQVGACRGQESQASAAALAWQGNGNRTRAGPAPLGLGAGASGPLRAVLPGAPFTLLLCSQCVQAEGLLRGRQEGTWREWGPVRLGGARPGPGSWAGQRVGQ